MSQLIPTGEHNFAKGVVLRHGIPVIDALSFQLRLKRFTVSSYCPNILRPSAALLHAEHTLRQTCSEQGKCGGSVMNLYNVT